MIYIWLALAWLFEAVEIQVKILYNFFVEKIIDSCGIEKFNG